MSDQVTGLSSDFRAAYHDAVRDVTPFLRPERLAGLAKHNPGWAPDRFSWPTYLAASERRYELALAMLTRSAGGFPRGSTLLDVGGFMGAFPLAVARLGYRVTLSERYDYYDGAFDDLRDFLTTAGIEIWDLDFTEKVSGRSETFDAVTNMAMLEHLAHSPKPLLDNLRAVLATDGALVVEVPNIAYWPKRLAALRGLSTLPPLRDVYDAAEPFTGHHREYTAAELRDLLSWAGFRVDEMAAFNYSPPGAVRMRYRPLIEWPSRLFRGCREVLMARASGV